MSRDPNTQEPPIDEPDDDEPETRQRRRDDDYDEWAGKDEWPYGQNF